MPAHATATMAPWPDVHALFRGSALGDSPDDTPPINALEALLQGLKLKPGA